MILKPLTLGECLQALKWREQLPESMRTAFPITEDAQKVFYRDVVSDPRSNSRFWSIWESSFYAMGGVTGIEWENSRAELSLICAPNYILTDYRCGHKLINHVFDTMGLHSLYAIVYHTNKDRLEQWERLGSELHAHRVVIPYAKFWNGKFHDATHLTFRKGELN